MTYAASSPAMPIAHLIVDAARRWRGERDHGGRVQPSLYAVLARHGYEMLSPVLDSLLTLTEAALGRRIAIGNAGVLSADENMLLEMLDGTHPVCPLASDGAMKTPLEGAVRSTRIMMKLALDQVSRVSLSRFRAS